MGTTGKGDWGACNMVPTNNGDRLRAQRPWAGPVDQVAARCGVTRLQGYRSRVAAPARGQRRLATNDDGGRWKRAKGLGFLFW
ncbi:hypothetical protein BHE74_00030873 [Ensete ventricosum]|nr:hypothetical protein BHE74_00030873 [Ensete ventricosum]